MKPTNMKTLLTLLLGLAFVLPAQAEIVKVTLRAAGLC